MYHGLNNSPYIHLRWAVVYNASTVANYVNDLVWLKLATAVPSVLQENIKMLPSGKIFVPSRVACFC